MERKRGFEIMSAMKEKRNQCSKRPNVQPGYDFEAAEDIVLPTLENAQIAILN